MINSFIARFLLIGEPTVSFSDRIKYLAEIIVTLAPVAFLLDLFNWWIKDNEQFADFITLAVVINMIVGMGFHLIKKSFNIKLFIYRNLLMVFVIACSYTSLELLRYTAGENIAGDFFKITIQIVTLLYPISKILKNCFILSNGKYPPEFIMKRLYNFQKNGDLSEFFDAKKSYGDNDTPMDTPEYEVDEMEK